MRGTTSKWSHSTTTKQKDTISANLWIRTSRKLHSLRLNPLNKRLIYWACPDTSFRLPFRASSSANLTTTSISTGIRPTRSTTSSSLGITTPKTSKNLKNCYKKSIYGLTQENLFFETRTLLQERHRTQTFPSNTQDARR